MDDKILNFLETRNLKSYKGVALIGSHARGDAHELSDVDLIMIQDEEKEHEIVIFEKNYYSLSYYRPKDLERYYRSPDLILNGLKAFGKMKPIYDPDGLIETVIKEAENFKFSSVLREQCKYKAKQEYLGFIEEATKAISGLEDEHKGKLLNGIYGLNYGMFNVIRLRDQIMIESDNDFFDAVMDHLDEKDPIRDCALMAFNIKSCNLIDQIDAGLELFMHVGNSLMDFFSDEEKEYVMKIIHEVIKVI
jgi:predicted nucleotidyltransferase